MIDSEVIATISGAAMLLLTYKHTTISVISILSWQVCDLTRQGYIVECRLGILKNAAGVATTTAIAERSMDYTLQILADEKAIRVLS
jgi:hypothetical protein